MGTVTHYLRALAFFAMCMLLLVTFENVRKLYGFANDWERIACDWSGAAHKWRALSEEQLALIEELAAALKRQTEEQQR